jgi:hypothetical protein
MKRPHETMQMRVEAGKPWEPDSETGLEERWRSPFPPCGNGLDLRKLPSGTVVLAQTKNTTYRIEVGTNGEMLLQGHPEHCPEPVATLSLGSVPITGMIHDRYLAEGMRMEFRIGERRVFTSRVISLRVAG